jgi:hypothetical protein
MHGGQNGPWYVERPIIRQIAPQFFTMEMAATLAYYKDKLGFDCVGTSDDPPVYARYRRARPAQNPFPPRRPAQAFSDGQKIIRLELGLATI